MTSPDLAMVGVYDDRLVAISALIAVLASYTALDLGGRVTAARGVGRLPWLVGGAIAMGIGIWAMHYIAMLAFSLPVPVQYDWPTVLLSLVAGILSSAVALFVVSRREMAPRRALIGSVFMGSGIAILHYTAMEAMRLPAMCHYSPPLVALSVTVAVAASLLSLRLTFLFRNAVTGRIGRKAASALLMGAAICLMHYTGMAATSFFPVAAVPDVSRAVSISTLGIAGIIVVTVMVLGIALLTSLVDRLQRQTALLDQLFEQAPNAVVLMSRENQVVRVNREFTRVFGYTAAETLGRRLDDLIVPDELRNEELRYTDLVAHGQRVETEGIRQRKDGARLHVSMVRMPVSVPGGQILLYAIYSDITERKRLDRALRESEERFRAFMNHLPGYAWIKNADGSYVFMNKQLRDILPQHQDDWLGRTDAELWPPAVAAEFQTNDQRVLRTREALQVVETWPQEGQTRYALASKFPIVDPHGGPTMVGGASIDITGRRQAEVERERYGEQLQELAHAAAVINSVASVDQVLRVATEEARAILDAHQAIISLTEDGSWARAVHMTSLSDRYAAYRSFEAQPDRSGIYALVCESNRPQRMTQAELESHPRWKQFGAHATQHPPLRGWLAAPLIGRDGRNLGLIQLSDKYEGDFTATDEAMLTQLAQMASIALENARLIAQIQSAREGLHHLSHKLVEAQEDERRRIARELHDQIGQALTALKFNLQSVQQTTGGAGSSLDESIDLAERTLQQVRDLSLALRPSLLDDLGLYAALRWQLDRQAQRAAWTARFSSDGCEQRLPTETETVCFRVAQEALTNAARHARATQVWLDVRRHDHELQLTVRDDGVGFNVDAARQNALGGLSMGLLGMQERVTLVDGRVEIDSRPGGGTEIRAYLPIAGDDERDQSIRGLS